MTAVAPPPCSKITYGKDIELLGKGMRDLGMGMHMLERWPNLEVWLLGAELPGDPSEPRPWVDQELRTRGIELYDLHCVICHGARGDGQGPFAAMLADRYPQNFTTGVYKLRTTPHGSLPTDIDLFRTISRGVHGTPMIPWTQLSERDRWALVERLKSFASDFADAPAAAPVTVPTPSAPTAGLISRGRRWFQTAGCASCHGASGRGDGPGAALLRDAVGRPVHPTDLTGDAYRRGASIKSIYVTLRTGLDGTPMASFEKFLSPEDLWAVATYVHSIAPRHVETASGVSCPEAAHVDGWEEEGVRMAIITLVSMGPMGPMMRSDRTW